jgi:hypothetical protein
MKEREFIELLNLYVDREISAEDALRLESAVLDDPKRREIYDQYCRMAKACTMLTEDTRTAAAEPIAVDFRPHRTWGVGPFAAGLAAAAVCAAVIITFKYRASELASLALSSPVAVSTAKPVAAPAAADADMKPVFMVRPLDLTSGSPARLQLAAEEKPAQANQLDWIGAIHLTPVLNATNSDLMNPRTGLKAATLSGLPAASDSDEASEMTAFRFQR